MLFQKKPAKLEELFFAVNRNKCILQKLIFADLQKFSLFQIHLSISPFFPSFTIYVSKILLFEQITNQPMVTRNSEITPMKKSRIDLSGTVKCSNYVWRKTFRTRIFKVHFTEIQILNFAKKKKKITKFHDSPPSKISDITELTSKLDCIIC